MVKLLSGKGRQNTAFENKTAIICGGSEGIGRAIAGRIVQMGGSVCLNARRPGPLEATARHLRTLAPLDSQFVDTIASDATDMESLKPQIDQFIAERGLPGYLINAVGYAYPQYVEKLTLADFRRNMDINYYGQLVPILIMLPHFMEARRGHIVNVTSLAGYIGMIGYATYAPTKAAITALSEVLRNELRPYNIRVSLLFPPDTDTPGFEIENQTKPEELLMLSEKWSRVYSAEEVADACIEGILKGKFEILVGDQRYLRTLSRLFPGLTRYIIDRELANARKNMKSPP